MINNWKKYQHALIWTGLPHKKGPSDTDAKNALKTMGGVFARWTSDFDCGYSTEWYYCLCEKYIPIEKLTAKQRYRINKGLKQCEVVCAKSIPSLDFHAIYELLKESFEDYPIEYRPNLHEYTCIKKLKILLKDPNVDIWLVYSLEKELIGYCQCDRQTDGDTIVWLKQVKVPTKHLAKEVNAALIYRLCEYYLKGGKYKFICDGERNIKHITNYQDFLVRVLNFRYAYCKLNIVYQWWLKITVDLLYPIRSIIKPMGKISPRIYDIYCVLFLEQIRRTFDKE